MKKAVKIEYGIEIVKPWSKAMHDHNERVADVVRDQLTATLEAFRADRLPDEESIQNDELQQFGKRVVGFGSWIGFTNDQIMHEIEREIENAPFYRLKDIAETLDIKLEKGFVGF